MQYYELYINNDYSYLIQNNEQNSLLIKYELEKVRNIKSNTKVGVIKVYLGDKIIHEEDIYVKELKKVKKSIFQKIKDWFNSLW